MDWEASAGYLLFPRKQESRNAGLKPVTWPAWLGEEPADAPQLKALLTPYLSDEMVAWPVSPRVGNVKNMTPA
jgi:putative SOS response-associated peptidase YedK